MIPRIDRTGIRYGKLIVLSYSHEQNKRSYWLCRCDCGKELTIRNDSLARGGSLSCGSPTCKETSSTDNRTKAQLVRDSYRKIQRDRVFNHYGTTCVYCGCSENLTIDHIDGKGGEHRKEINRNLYNWLIANEFPSGFQTLCDYHNRMKGEKTHNEFVAEIHRLSTLFMALQSHTRS